MRVRRQERELLPAPVIKQDFCDGCGARFRPSPLNAPGVCTQCTARWGVYATRYES